MTMVILLHYNTVGLISSTRWRYRPSVLSDIDISQNESVVEPFKGYD
jgi:hypothetical protein